jgi:putative glutamine amidotransferase
LNVALGGTLHQAVHDVDGKFDHREPNADDMDTKFDLAHPIKLHGRLREWIGQDKIMVNSLHGQGIRSLAPRLEPQAYADDGIVEAVLGPKEHPFMLGVQWHPEWKAAANPVSVNLFRRFGDAVREKQS